MAAGVLLNGRTFFNISLWKVILEMMFYLNGKINCAVKQQQLFHGIANILL